MWTLPLGGGDIKQTNARQQHSATRLHRVAHQRRGISRSLVVWGFRNRNQAPALARSASKIAPAIAGVRVFGATGCPEATLSVTNLRLPNSAVCTELLN